MNPAYENRTINNKNYTKNTKMNSINRNTE